MLIFHGVLTFLSKVAFHVLLASNQAGRWNGCACSLQDCVPPAAVCPDSCTAGVSSELGKCCLTAMVCWHCFSFVSSLVLPSCGNVWVWSLRECAYSLLWSCFWCLGHLECFPFSSYTFPEIGSMAVNLRKQIWVDGCFVSGSLLILFYYCWLSNRAFQKIVCFRTEALI